jgi:signal transduction histidine kinase
MRERAAHLNAEFVVRSAPEAGTEISVRVPLAGGHAENLGL